MYKYTQEIGNKTTKHYNRRSGCKMFSDTIYCKIPILIIYLAGNQFSMSKAAFCSDCPKIILGKESRNISYGPSNGHSCNCEWTIPVKFATDNNNAIVLLLQNISLPMTTGSGSIDCSGEIRLPGSDKHRCDFVENQCSVFMTESSTLCKNKQIEIFAGNKTINCSSPTYWNKAGGSPYKIKYNAKNFAPYTKSFVIQYLVTPCIPPTTTSDITTTQMTTSAETKKIIEAATTKNTVTDPPNFDDSGSSSGNTGVPTNMIMIIGIIIGGVFLLALAIGLFLRRNTTKKNQVKIQQNQLNKNTDNMDLYEPYQNNNKEKVEEVDDDDEIYGKATRKNVETDDYTSMEGHETQNRRVDVEVDNNGEPQYDDNVASSPMYDDNVVRHGENVDHSPEYDDSIILKNKGDLDIYAAVAKKG
ncbi:uncharacterized protein LOC144429975 [Styela clava]